MTTEELLTRYPTAKLVTEYKEVTELMRTSKSQACVYMMIADGEFVIVGEGTEARCKVLFQGFAAPSHLKAAIAAFATLVADRIERIVIPIEDKEERKRVESEIHDLVEFKKEANSVRTRRYFKMAMKHAGLEERSNFTTLLLPVLDAQGSEMGGWKRWRTEYEELAPGFNAFVTRLFGGYYSDL